jgi:hypothetical protein
MEISAYVFTQAVSNKEVDKVVNFTPPEIDG